MYFKCSLGQNHIEHVSKKEMIFVIFLKTFSWGAWVAQQVKHLPSAQVMIPESWDWAPHWAPCSAGVLLFPIPLSPSFSPSAFLSPCLCTLSLSLFLSEINKYNLQKKKKTHILLVVLSLPPLYTPVCLAGSCQTVRTVRSNFCPNLSHFPIGKLENSESKEHTSYTFRPPRLHCIHCGVFSFPGISVR